ncbi:MAG: siroheme synthase CysG [Mesorhizobium sp.]|nr:siroheme synthase CysG [Mesorhizobium sp.]MCO5162647.1 siroheme synthase CysG [Mesorhizobium sp.]
MQVVSRLPSEENPARIRPLSVLPVFLDLVGKRAVVVGGSEAAAWKAELLAAAGARVEVFAGDEQPSHEMLRVAAREPVLTIQPRRWDAACLAGAAVALADAEDEAEAAAFQSAARAAGAACNVIDRPAFCDFQFGTIVNRSPVVVGISTSGAAPILGQAVRRKIETLLPPSLADWASLARAVRERVVEALAPGPARRAFWEGFVDRSFGPAPSDAVETDIARLLRGADRKAKSGRVTFVGAGPGDAELLTLKAVRALQAADVILFDDLVSDDVLELARREARRILVGKRAGRPSCKQDEINALMVKLARAGRHVVRLKSGDPMIFGRAGEEIAELKAAGIAYDVVPGITAGLALAAALGVSLTHRDMAKSVRFVTGHSKSGGLPQDVDWCAVADLSATTVFYMGARTAGLISERLIAEGLPPETPACIAANVGRPGMRTARTSLGDLAAATADFDRSAPILIGVGSVFAEKRQVAQAEPGIALAMCA